MNHERSRHEGLVLVAFLVFGCGTRAEERSPAKPTLLFATGRSGTQTVTLRAGDADGTSRALLDVELETAPVQPIAGFDYAQTGDFFQWRDSGLRASPDGSAVFFLHDQSAEVLDVASGVAAQFSPLKNVDGWPKWSPEGSRLVYRSGHRVFTADRATGRVSLIADFGDDCLAALEWSPDESRLAYLVNRNGDCDGPSELHVVSAAGDDDRLIDTAATFCGTEYRSAPSVWSADGTHIVYVSTSIPVPAEGEPFIGTLSFRTVSVVGPTIGTADASLELPAADYEPALDSSGSAEPYPKPTLPVVCEWSPMTNWLAISGRALHVLRADGGEQHRLDGSLFPLAVSPSPEDLSNAQIVYQSLVWAPDGRRLARIGHDGTSFRLRTFRPSASDTASDELDVELPHGGGPCCTYFVWAPTGKHALYTHYTDPSPDALPGPPAETHLWHVERGVDEHIGEQSAYGFNAEGSRVFYGTAGNGDATQLVRPVDGGRAVALPSGAIGWVGEKTVAVMQDDDVLVRPLDGAKGSVIWRNTPDARLLSLLAPRPF